MTKYEFSAIISERAEELARGAVPLIPVNGYTGMILEYGKIAEQELREKKLNWIKIIRPLPSGKREIWHIDELYIPWFKS